MDETYPSNVYRFGPWLFLRALGACYLLAFFSLWIQVDGLIGSQGILPVSEYLTWISENLGSERYWKLPTLLWLSSEDWMLHLLCGIGVLMSGLLAAGFASRPVLVVLWGSYLSLSVGGQAFLGFQWDTLLLEAGICALFIAPSGLRPRPVSRPSRIGLWVIWLLLFKLMFLSGAVKPLCMDETWWRLTALDFHYWTQPLPTWTSWYAHQLPPWFQKASVLATYALEIALPFLIFFGALGRRLVAFGTVGLMLIISWTGNYGFFNLLTMVLCLPLLDDLTFARLPTDWRPSLSSQAPMTKRSLRALGAVAATLFLALSAQTAVRELTRTVPPGHEPLAHAIDVADRWILRWASPLQEKVAAFRSVNGYGLFRSMTTARPEIGVEGSHDGQTWKAYGFKWKPGDPARAPGFVGPHMPRLDWQMWFAALAPQRAKYWLLSFMERLLEGSPAVIGLMGHNPFQDQPPRYVRLVYYQYRFTTPRERRETGHWWIQIKEGDLTGPITLEQMSRLP